MSIGKDILEALRVEVERKPPSKREVEDIKAKAKVRAEAMAQKAKGFWNALVKSNVSPNVPFPDTISRYDVQEVGEQIDFPLKKIKHVTATVDPYYRSGNVKIQLWAKDAIQNMIDDIERQWMREYDRASKDEDDTKANAIEGWVEAELYQYDDDYWTPIIADEMRRHVERVAKRFGMEVNSVDWETRAGDAEIILNLTYGKGMPVYEGKD